MTMTRPRDVGQSKNRSSVADPRSHSARIQSEREPSNSLTEKNTDCGITERANPPSPVPLRDPRAAKTPRNLGNFSAYVSRCRESLCLSRLNGGERRRGATDLWGGSLLSRGNTGNSALSRWSQFGRLIRMTEYRRIPRAPAARQIVGFTACDPQRSASTCANGTSAQQPNKGFPRRSRLALTAGKLRPQRKRDSNCRCTLLTTTSSGSLESGGAIHTS
jgi:hypothetical protein